MGGMKGLDAVGPGHQHAFSVFHHVPYFLVEPERMTPALKWKDAAAGEAQPKKMDVEGSEFLFLNMCGIFISCLEESGPSDGTAFPVAEFSQSTKTLTQLGCASVSRFLERERGNKGVKDTSTHDTF